MNDLTAFEAVLCIASIIVAGWLVINWFCFHKYILQAKKSNFYGEVKYSKCSKCSKKKVDVIGWPELGLPSKTTYTHYNLGDIDNEQVQ